MNMQPLSLLRYAACAVICGLLSPSLPVIHAAGVSKPNIILIFADDLGWKDVGYQGSDFMETPVLDALAKEGMIFTNAYAAAANCAPSMACMLSGTCTPRHHVYAVRSTDRGPKESMRLVPIPNKSGLAKENVTFADALKAAGYVTGIFGKWHLDGKDGAAPAEQGFDVVHQSYGGWKANESENPCGIYSLTKAAGEFMEKTRIARFSSICRTTRSTPQCRRARLPWIASRQSPPDNNITILFARHALMNSMTVSASF